MTTPEDVLMTPKACAAYLNVREQTLATWRCNRRYALPFIRLGRTIRYRRSDILAYLASQTVANGIAVEEAQK